jgi:hypothetical protein
MLALPQASSLVLADWVPAAPSSCCAFHLLQPQAGSSIRFCTTVLLHGSLQLYLASWPASHC